MGDPKHVDVLNQGVPAWNRWRRENPLVIPNLSGAELKNAKLGGIDFSRAYFGYGTPGTQGVYFEAGIHEANLTGADLSYANLIGVDLRGADLRGSDLFRTVFGKCDLSGVDFAGSHMSGTIFAEVKLSGSKGLDEVRHTGPTTIGIDSIYLSEGNISERFLLDAGVPEPFMAYALSLVAQPIRFYSCVISYSSKDHEFTQTLHSDLRSHGVRCWFAPEDLKIGDPFRQRIDDAIRIHDKLLLVLSQHSVMSDWVREEVETCLERERREKRVVLFPIRLDDAVLDVDQAWAASIRRQRYIGDFRAWKDRDAYKDVFERLLRDLSSDQVAPCEPSRMGIR